MYHALLAVSIVLASIVMGLAFAHALERPGKLRLDRNFYLIVQSIYAPSFMIGGITEPLGIVATAILLALTPSDDPMFWPVLIAFLTFVLLHVVFWTVVRPANKFWTEERKRNGGNGDWTAMRDQWDAGHIARAVLGAIGLTALVTGSVTGVFL